MKKDNEMTRQELLSLVKRIMEVDGTEKEMGHLRFKLKQYARSGKISDYIYYPEPGDPKNPTIEQIVEKAIELRNANPTVFLMPPPK